VQLDRIAIKLRPRSGNEAVDLGFNLATHWWRSVYLAWWLPVLPLAIALHLGFSHNPWIAIVILWWLKPLFDRFVLYSLSREVFGQPIGAAQLLSAWRQIISPGLLYSLTLARLDPARSYNLPVSILERQSGSPARRRRGLLGRRFYGTAAGLTVVCLSLELIVQIGLAVSVELFFQPGGDPLNDSGQSLPMEFISGQWWNWTDSLYYLIAVGIIEPLYVAGGFSLYLNRRVVLEGWDVELALKRLAAKSTPLLVVFALLGASIVLPAQRASAHEMGECLPNGELYFGQAHGDSDGDSDDGEFKDELIELEDEPEDRRPGEIDDAWDPRDDWSEEDLAAAQNRCTAFAAGPQDTAARRAIAEVFADPVFGKEVTEERWMLRDGDDDDDDDDRTDASPALKGLGQLIASLWQVIAWVILAALILLLIRHIARSWTPTTAKQADQGLAPTELFGLQMDPDSLPPDVSATARQWLEQGKLREALGLLYRGCLSELVHTHGLRLNKGATEGDVLTRSEGRISESAQLYVADLVGHWVELAYAEHQPAVDRLEQLCDGYALYFEQPPEAEAPVQSPAEVDA